jgi:hypothetical protein
MTRITTTNPKRKSTMTDTMQTPITDDEVPWKTRHLIIQRLAAASGCPENVAAIPWLIERGLIVEDDVGYHIRKPGPLQTEN